MGAFSWRFVLWFSVLILTACFMAVMSVTMTIRAHAEPMERYSCTPSGGAKAPVCHVTREMQVIHITDDLGGNVGVYYQKYKALSDAGTEIHFHGVCMSACTMVFFTSFTGIKACADEGAVFGFHKPFGLANGKVMRSKADVRETRKIWVAWLEELPPGLRKYLQNARVPSATEGDEQNTLLLLPGYVLLPKCSVSVTAK